MNGWHGEESRPAVPRRSSVHWPVFWAVFLALVAAAALFFVVQVARERAAQQQVVEALKDFKAQTDADFQELRRQSRASQQQADARRAAANRKQAAAKRCDSDARVLLAVQQCVGGYVIDKHGSVYEQVSDVRGQVARCTGRYASTPLRVVPGC